MTIFIKAAKALIDRALNKSLDDAASKDNAYGSSLWRDTKLSEKQKSTTRGLQKHIDQFIRKGNDKNSLIALKELISDVDKEVEQFRKLKSQPRGNLNDTLVSIQSELERFYNALERSAFKLIDIEDNDDPFHILCAHAAYYLGEDIFYPAEDGFVHKTINAVSKTTSIEIRTKKETCLIQHLVACKIKLDGLDKEGDDYKKLRETFVTEEIEAIQRENQKICTDSMLWNTLPISFGSPITANVAAPAPGPSEGRLEVSMQNALIEIQEKSTTRTLAPSF